MLIERLYQGLEIPQGTDAQRVVHLHSHLVVRLVEAMKKRHVWLAACTVAVNAGVWKGRRLRRQRLKLLTMINKTRAFLGLPYIALHDGWENVGIYDGYGAIDNWRKETGESVNMAFAYAAAIEGNTPRVIAAVQAEIEDRVRKKAKREALLAWSEERK